jgi:tripartite ATP-independent transporter DctM subunit
MAFAQLGALMFPMLILMMLGAPIFLAMGISCGLFVIIFDLPTMILAKSYVTGLASYDFLALPFYFLAGDLMTSGGITEKMVKFCQSLIGHVKGGLSHVTIVGNMIMAGVSGSAIVDASAIGSVMIKAMKKAGFPAGYTAAINASAATIGPIIPPSIPFVIYGLVAQLSVGKLFLAGAFPGIMMGIYLLVVSYVVSRRRNYPATERATLKQIFVTMIRAFPALVMPGIILGGILSGIVTPTEAGVVAVVYGFLVGAFVYRTLNLRELPQLLSNTMVNSASIMIIIATTGLFCWIIANMGMGPSLIKMFLSISTNKWVILFIINIFFLLWGCFFEILTALLIIVPVLIPLMQQLGVDLIHFGVIVVLNLMIGMLTPPVGVLLYLCASMSEAKIEEAVKELVWPLVALLVALFVCTYVPQVVLWLPNHFLK